MLTAPGSTDDLARLRREREEADRIYNDALTALDRATRQKMPEFPTPPAPYDEFQITPLNERWDLMRLKPGPEGGWFGRLWNRVWTKLSPLVEGQEAFNSIVVDHINRNVAAHRDTATALAALLSLVRHEIAELLTIQTKLVVYAQQVTPYVDTKDRYVAGLPNALAAGMSGLTDSLQKRWESMDARERRYEAEITEVRSTLAVVQHAIQTVKREMERLNRGAGSPAPTAAAGAPSQEVSALDSYKYVAFEDQFRGSQRDIRERLRVYVPMFQGSQDVMDIGCGRGEFLDLLREESITARGVDLNDEMAAVCRSRGLEASSGDALQYLAAQPDASLGGIFAGQVVEHLEPTYLMRLLDTAFHKLRPGSKIVLETINPACWYAFFSSYIRDITHVRPLHPDTLRYLLMASGFQELDIRYSAPFPEESKLQLLPTQTSGVAIGDPLPQATAVFNENVAKLNALLFTYLDYAAIGTKP